MGLDIPREKWLNKFANSGDPDQTPQTKIVVKRDFSVPIFPQDIEDNQLFFHILLTFTTLGKRPQWLSQMRIKTSRKHGKIFNIFE